MAFALPLFVGLLTAAILGGLGGCSRAAKPASLKGTVKFGGIPVAKGSVRLATQDGTQGPGGLGSIEGGEFEIDSSKGLKAGKYLVIIHGFKESGRTVQIDDSSPPKKQEIQFLPRKYNDDSKETIELQAGENEKDFELIP